MKRRLALLSMLMSLSVAALGLGCDDSEDEDNAAAGDGANCPEPTLDISVCDPAAGPFSLTIDNEFFPLEAGAQSVLEGEDDEGVVIRVEIDVLDETEDVAGVTTRVVRETEYEDGEVVEISRNWFAQAPDGTVCYFGEDVDIYEGGQVVSHQGAWRAGENEAQAGIIMPGSPQVGDVFEQERAPGVAEDSSEILAFGEAITVPAGPFDDTLTTEDCDPIGGSTDRKVYVRGIGLAIDADAELISY
ncbi:MAG: hypothetical protein AB1640_21470 [bacterium]